MRPTERPGAPPSAPRTSRTWTRSPTLEELDKRLYLRAIPVDPLTESASTWVALVDPVRGGVYDVRSGASGEDTNGVRNADW